MERYNIKGLPWANGIGKFVNDCITSRDVMQKANLDWTVKKCEVFGKMPFTIGGDNTINSIDELNGAFSRDGSIFRYLPDVYATYRTDKAIPLGLVKSKYEVVQNIDAFNFFDNAIGPDKCQWQYAGSIGYGHKIFVTAKLKIDINIKCGIIEDPIDNYLVFSNSHDGSSSITIMFTPVRVFCLNCLNAGFNKASSYIRIRHTESAKQKLDLGSEILYVAKQKAESAKELYNALYTAKMSDDEVLAYLTRLNLNEDELKALIDYDPEYGCKKLINRDYMTMESTGISVRKANTIQSMYNYYFEGAGQNHILGTAWGAYNAVTGYFSNVANLDGSKRMESILYGNSQNVMQKAIVDVCSIAKAA